MITREQAAAVIGRMSLFGRAYSDLDRPAVEAYIAAMMKAPDVPAAQRFMTDWIETQEWMPKVANLVSAFELSPQEWLSLETEAKQNRWSEEAGLARCRLCGDCGFTDATGAWEWCLCLAGEEKRAKSPDLVKEANMALEKLKKIGNPLFLRMVGRPE